MSTAILATKLYIPPPRPNLVRRPRLFERLNAGLQRKLTLISAPAGFGKTTLIGAWVATSAQPVAWLVLDSGDSDPIRFLTYLVAALQTMPMTITGSTTGSKIGEGTMALLQSTQPPREPSAREGMLTALLNEIATIPNDFMLVLDDYHTVEAKAVDDVLVFLLEHLPPQMHLLITTREDPPFPLARYRARGQLAELRVEDLRFTADEAAEFLNQVMRLNLPAKEIAALESRTEGWITGLQLAALSMQDRTDTTAFIQAFTGSHHFIIDYLVEEVLQRQPDHVSSFLLQTSILDRLSGPLCDAVTGQEGGRGMLTTLERGNLFVVPLDDQRQWYRYHHLFADVLQARLTQGQLDTEGGGLPLRVSSLHQRASAWYAQQGYLADAIHHALAAADFEQAANLIETVIPATRRSRQEATMLGWLKALPDEIVRTRPVLTVHYVGMLLQSGEIEGVEMRLRDAERWLEMPTDQGEQPIFMDEEDFHRLPGLVAMYHAGIALIRGDVTNTITYARRVLELTPENDDFLRGAASALLGLASWTSGDLETAYRTYSNGMAHLQRAGHISDAIGGAIALADIRIVQGRLREAMRIYERGLQLATEQHPDGTRPVLRGMADMYVGMSDLHREHNDLHAATQNLLRSQELGEHMGFPQNPYRWRVAMARIKQAQGDLDGALTLLQEADHLYVSDFYPNVRPVAALKARVWIAQGRLDEAFDWAREQELSVQDDLSYLREFEHITLARVTLAHGQSDRADDAILELFGFLARLLKAAEEAGRTRSAIEILLLQALAHHAQGNIAAALLPLERALTLAEPGGYVRIFVDEGPAMAQLLLEAAKRAIMPDYIGKLLAAFGVVQARNPEQSTLSPAPAAQPLIEPLSQRELDVLRLFKTELSGPEIAQHLMIALSTVRTHTKSIYSKLNVDSRRAAVNRATELDLL